MSENNHIEEFFKNRLASQDFSFQEEDWLKMERKLNIAGISRSDTAITHLSVRTIIIIVAALTGAFILGWIARELSDDKKKSGEIQNSNGVLPSQNKSSVPLIADSQNGKETGSTFKVEPPGESAVEKSEPGYSLSKAASSTAPVSVPVRQNITGPYDLQSVAETLMASSTPANNPGNATLQKRPSLFKPIPFNYSRELQLTANSGPKTHVSVLNPFNRWSVGLLLAPDFNSTGVMQGKTISPVAGGMLSYRITSRFSLSARILYNNKKYSSPAEDYRVPYGYWRERTNGIIPDVVDGSCRVLDVPVLLTYHFYNRQRLSLSISAGPGSYFLMDEKYKFTFGQDNPGADTQWQTGENSRVLFGIANLAAGIEFRTGQRTSVGLEPYLKIPLKGMGWANVNLSGMGLSFLIKYHL